MHDVCQEDESGLARALAFGHPSGLMLRFRKNSSDPLKDARSAERWVAALPANDPLATQRTIVPELHRLTARSARRTPAVLEAVFLADKHANGTVRNLTAQYVKHAESSPKLEEQLWQALNALAQAFGACYAAFAREISDPVPRNKWAAVLPQLIARQILHLRRDATLHLYRCERWSPAKWTALFAPFSRACSLRIEREPVRLDVTRATTTIERQFLMLLVLKLADPGNLAPKDVEWITAQLDEWCQPLRLALKASTANSFYVDLAGSTGLQRRPLAPLEGRVLFCDVRPLLALMQQNRVALEEAVRNEPRTGKKSKHRGELELFVKLASRIDPDFKPLARQGERKAASGAVDAVVGFSNICAFVRSDMSRPTVDQSAGRSFGTTQELAVFGRLRVETEVQREPAAGRVSTFAAAGGPWEIKDISASGFRLYAPMSAAGELTLNMLVAIRRHGEEAWVMGIIRRMRRLTTRDAEIGLQLIANSLARAEFTEQKKPPGASTVNGGKGAIKGRQFDGLFLSFRRRPEEPAVQSLVIPAGEYHTSRRYTLRIGKSERTIRHGRLLEQHTDWVWAVIDNVAPESDVVGSHSAS
jgi:hypothetical protein